MWILGFRLRRRGKNLARFGMGKVVKPKRRLVETYKYPGFRPRATIREVEGDPGTLVVSLERRSKKLSAVSAAWCTGAGTTAGCAKFATWVVAATMYGWSLKFGASPVAAAAA